MQDYIQLRKKAEGIKKKLMRDGKIGKYTLYKIYKDKAVLLDNKGHRVCLTFMELVNKFTRTQQGVCIKEGY